MFHFHTQSPNSPLFFLLFSPLLFLPLPCFIQISVIVLKSQFHRGAEKKGEWMETEREQEFDTDFEIYL